MHAPDQTKAVMRPSLAAAKDFASGRQTPQQFLEGSFALLDQWEPRIGAFVCTNLPNMRRGGAIHRTLACRQTIIGDRRHAGWHQGHHRDGGHADREGLTAARRMALAEGRRGCALCDAGAVVVGETVTTEFTESQPRGTRNPWNVAHMPGGWDGDRKRNACAPSMPSIISSPSAITRRC